MTYEHKDKLIACVIVFLYILLGFLTYGYTKVRRDMRADNASVAGVFWPVYWGSRLAMSAGDAAEWVFTDSPPPKVERSAHPR